MNKERYKELLERRKPSNPCPCGGYMSDWHSHASDCIEINSKDAPILVRDYNLTHKIANCPECDWEMRMPKDLEKYTKWLCSNCDYNLKYCAD